MKTTALTPLLVILMTIAFSCKDEEGKISANLEGRWQGDHMDAKVTYALITLHEEEDEDFDALLEFKDDGTVEFTRDGNTTSGTYQLNGTKLTTNVDLQMEGIEISTVTFDVMELSATKLRLHLNQDQEVEVPDVGPVNTTIKANLVFDRL
jgi:hypothetical protein